MNLNFENPAPQVISVPLEMRELLRQIQHAEQLSPAIHWHGNLRSVSLTISSSSPLPQ